MFHNKNDLVENLQACVDVTPRRHMSTLVNQRLLDLMRSKDISCWVVAAQLLRNTMRMPRKMLVFEEVAGKVICSIVTLEYKNTIWQLSETVVADEVADEVRKSLLLTEAEKYRILGKLAELAVLNVVNLVVEQIGSTAKKRVDEAFNVVSTFVGTFTTERR